jgi:hypothetical protein
LTVEGGKKLINYRLMQDDEIPSWFLSAVILFLFSAKRTGTSKRVWKGQQTKKTGELL